MSSETSICLMIANFLPEEVIVEKLEEAIANHKLINTKETRNTLASFCMLFCTKQITEENGLAKTMDEVAQTSAFRDRMNGNKS